MSCSGPDEVARVWKPMLDWFAANNIDYRSTPAEAGLIVDEATATITVEQFYRNPAGRPAVHAGHVMSTTVTVPLLVAPPDGLLDAYRHTVIQVRRDRLLKDAAMAVRELLGEASTVDQGAIWLKRCRPGPQEPRDPCRPDDGLGGVPGHDRVVA